MKREEWNDGWMWADPPLNRGEFTFTSDTTMKMALSFRVELSFPNVNVTGRVSAATIM